MSYYPKELNGGPFKTGRTRVQSVIMSNGPSRGNRRDTEPAQKQKSLLVLFPRKFAVDTNLLLLLSRKMEWEGLVDVPASLVDGCTIPRRGRLVAVADLALAA